MTSLSLIPLLLGISCAKTSAPVVVTTEVAPIAVEASAENTPAEASESTAPTETASGDEPEYLSIENGKQYLQLSMKQITILKNKAPKYPYEARKEGPAEASCTVQFLVNESGAADEIRIVDCLEIFHNSIHSIKDDWVFQPYEQDGTAIPFVFTLKITFRLQ